MDTQRIEELVDLKGKVAVVTGGALGIGQAIAMALADVGAAVMIADSNLDAAYQTIGEIRERGGYAEALYADMCSAEDARRIMDEVAGRFGALDILVNSAATFSFSAALCEIQELWSKTLSAHVKGVFYYSHAAAQKMAQTGRGGRIINIASMDAMRPAPHPVLGDTRGNSVAQITKALALEFGAYKVTANALAPGIVQTPSIQFQAEAMRTVNRSHDYLMTPLADLPRDQVGGAEEIATTVLFLVSDAGADITGNLVVVE